MNRVFKPSNVETEFLAARIRSQIDSLCEIVLAIEANSLIPDEYIYENLKEVEGDLRKTRKYLKQLIAY